MNISKLAFSGPLMSAFNGRGISPAMDGPDKPVTGASGDTKLYHLVHPDTNAVMQTQGLYLSNDQVSN